jgi:hypothetical protein
MIKKLFFVLFVAISFSAFAQPVANCSMMCVLNITLDTVNNEMEVTLFNGDTNQINYPTIQVIDMNGDTVGNAAGTFTLFAQGQGTITHEIPTTLTVLPQPFICTVLVTDQIWDTTCTFSYPMSCPMNIQDSETRDVFAVYPNPAIDLLTINLPKGKTGKVDLSITNTLGEVFRGPVLAQNGKIELQVDDLACGMYFITVIADDQQYMQRFIKK